MENKNKKIEAKLKKLTHSLQKLPYTFVFGIPLSTTTEIFLEINQKISQFH